MEHVKYLEFTRTLGDSESRKPSPKETDLADRAHRRMLYRAGKEAEIFINNGIDAYNFKRCLGWKVIDGEDAYSSFDAYLATPHTVAILAGHNQDGSPIYKERIISYTPSTVHLGVQIVYGLMYLFWIPSSDLVEIGQKKLALLMPYLIEKVLCRGVFEMRKFLPIIEHHPDLGDVITGEREVMVPVPLRSIKEEWAVQEWTVLREIVKLWITRGRTLSYTDLSILIGKSKGWDTTFSKPIPVGYLRQFPQTRDLLGYLGLSDLPDDQEVVINVKFRRGMVIPPKSPDTGV
jgi:hypothetical protein